MFLDVQNFCKCCEICLRNKRSYDRKEPLKPINMPFNFPRALIAMDIAYLPWTSNGYRYVLIIVDLFSKFMEAIPMKNQESATIAEALQYGWFHRYGYPLALLSDQCPNVDGTVIRELCGKYGIRKLHSSAYHPEGDGEAERTIQSFKQTMRCCLGERKILTTDWPKLAQEISFICNSQINASTKYTPQEVMFGEKLRSKVDTIIPQAGHSTYDNPSSYIEAACPNNLELNEIVSKNIDHAQSKMKATYDKKSRASTIGTGDWVLIKDETRNNTLAPLYLGPWLVAEKLDVNLNLVDPSSGRKKLVHLNRCKLSPRNMELTNESDSHIYDSDGHPSMELDQVEIGIGDSEVDITGPRRSSRIRRDPDRYGDFEYSWRNKGNQSSNGDFGGEGEL